MLTLKETLIIEDIRKAESNNCFIIHEEENNAKHTLSLSRGVRSVSTEVEIELLFEIMHCACARNLQIGHLSASG